jgi:hypothetical protein
MRVGADGKARPATITQPPRTRTQWDPEDPIEEEEEEDDEEIEDEDDEDETDEGDYTDEESNMIDSVQGVVDMLVSGHQSYSIFENAQYWHVTRAAVDAWWDRMYPEFNEGYVESQWEQARAAVRWFSDNDQSLGEQMQIVAEEILARVERRTEPPRIVEAREARLKRERAAAEREAKRVARKAKREEHPS